MNVTLADSRCIAMSRQMEENLDIIDLFSSVISKGRHQKGT